MLYSPHASMSYTLSMIAIPVWSPSHTDLLDRPGASLTNIWPIRGQIHVGSALFPGLSGTVLDGSSWSGTVYNCHGHSGPSLGNFFFQSGVVRNCLNIDRVDSRNVHSGTVLILCVQDGPVSSCLTPCWVRDGPGLARRSVAPPWWYWGQIHIGSVLIHLNPLWCRVGSGVTMFCDCRRIQFHPGSHRIKISPDHGCSVLIRGASFWVRLRCDCSSVISHSVPKYLTLFNNYTLI